MSQLPAYRYHPFTRQTMVPGSSRKHYPAPVLRYKEAAGNTAIGGYRHYQPIKHLNSGPYVVPHGIGTFAYKFPRRVSVNAFAEIGKVPISGTTPQIVMSAGPETDQLPYEPDRVDLRDVYGDIIQGMYPQPGLQGNAKPPPPPPPGGTMPPTPDSPIFPNVPPGGFGGGGGGGSGDGGDADLQRRLDQLKAGADPEPNFPNVPGVSPKHQDLFTPEELAADAARTKAKMDAIRKRPSIPKIVTNANQEGSMEMMVQPTEMMAKAEDPITDDALMARLNALNEGVPAAVSGEVPATGLSVSYSILDEPQKQKITRQANGIKRGTGKLTASRLPQRQYATVVKAAPTQDQLAKSIVQPPSVPLIETSTTESAPAKSATENFVEKVKATTNTLIDNINATKQKAPSTREVVEYANTMGLALRSTFDSVKPSQEQKIRAKAVVVAGCETVKRGIEGSCEAAAPIAKFVVDVSPSKEEVLDALKDIALLPAEITWELAKAATLGVLAFSAKVKELGPKIKPYLAATGSLTAEAINLLYAATYASVMCGLSVMATAAPIAGQAIAASLKGLWTLTTIIGATTATHFSAGLNATMYHLGEAAKTAYEKGTTPNPKKYNKIVKDVARTGGAGGHDLNTFLETLPHGEGAPSPATVEEAADYAAGGDFVRRNESRAARYIAPGFYSGMDKKGRGKGKQRADPIPSPPRRVSDAAPAQVPEPKKKRESADALALREANENNLKSTRKSQRFGKRR